MEGVGLEGHFSALRRLSFLLGEEAEPHPISLGLLGEKLLLGKLAVVEVKSSQSQGD